MTFDRKIGTTAALLAMLASAGGCRSASEQNIGHDYTRHAVSSNYTPAQKDTAIDTEPPHYTFSIPAQKDTAASNYPLTLEFVVPPVGKAIKANPAAFPESLKAEDIGFYYVTPPIRTGRDAFDDVLKRLQPYLDSLGAEVGEIELYPDVKLTEYMQIPVKYEDSTSIESRINSRLMETFVRRGVGHKNFMQARNAKERGDDRKTFLGHDGNVRGAVYMTGIAADSDSSHTICQPCRYFVYAPRRPR